MTGHELLLLFRHAVASRADVVILAVLSAALLLACRESDEGRL